MLLLVAGREAALLPAPSRPACWRPSAGSAAGRGGEQRTRCRAAPWDMLQGPMDMLKGPVDMLKGSMLDPNYWKQQQFLAEKLRKYLPQRKLIKALEICPNDHKHLGYLVPAEGSGCRLDRYIAFGELTDDVIGTVRQQGDYFKVEVECLDWTPSMRISVSATDLIIKKDNLDVALVAEGTSARHRACLPAYLKYVSTLLKPDGRLIFLANEEDEKALGGRLEGTIQQQDLEELEELKQLGIDDLDGADDPVGLMLRESGFRLARSVRDDCGLTVGVCIKRQAPPPATKKVVAARTAVPARPTPVTGGAQQRGRPPGRRR